jgi:hypothetical protein
MSLCDLNQAAVGFGDGAHDRKAKAKRAAAIPDAANEALEQRSR